MRKEWKVFNNDIISEDCPIHGYKKDIISTSKINYDEDATLNFKNPKVFFYQKDFNQNIFNNSYFNSNQKISKIYYKFPLRNNKQINSNQFINNYNDRKYNGFDDKEYTNNYSFYLSGSPHLQPKVTINNVSTQFSNRIYNHQNINQNKISPFIYQNKKYENKVNSYNQNCLIKNNFSPKIYKNKQRNKNENINRKPEVTIQRINDNNSFLNENNLHNFYCNDNELYINQRNKFLNLNKKEEDINNYNLNYNNYIYQNNENYNNKNEEKINRSQEYIKKYELRKKSENYNDYKSDYEIQPYIKKKYNNFYNDDENNSKIRVTITNLDNHRFYLSDSSNNNSPRIYHTFTEEGLYKKKRNFLDKNFHSRNKKKYIIYNNINRNNNYNSNTKKINRKEKYNYRNKREKDITNKEKYENEENVEQNIEKFYDNQGHFIGEKKTIVKRKFTNNDKGERIIRETVEEEYKSNYNNFKKNRNINENLFNKDNYNILNKNNDNLENEIIINQNENEKGNDLLFEIDDYKDEKEADEQKIIINSEFEDEEEEEKSKNDINNNEIKNEKLNDNINKEDLENNINNNFNIYEDNAENIDELVQIEENENFENNYNEKRI